MSFCTVSHFYILRSPHHYSLMHFPMVEQSTSTPSTKHVVVVVVFGNNNEIA